MNINFTKYTDGLVPAIVQDASTKKVLMLGFMNQAAVDATISLQKVTFFSRSKNRLWTKGEESGNHLNYLSMALDCDQDTLLIQAIPVGPVCHTGTDTCWGTENKVESHDFLVQLEHVIEQRKSADPDSSYVASLFAKGMNKIAQKHMSADINQDYLNRLLPGISYFPVINNKIIQTNNKNQLRFFKSGDLINNIDLDFNLSGDEVLAIYSYDEKLANYYATSKCRS